MFTFYLIPHVGVAKTCGCLSRFCFVVFTITTEHETPYNDDKLSVRNMSKRLNSPQPMNITNAKKKNENNHHKNENENAKRFAAHPAADKKFNMKIKRNYAHDSSR